MAYTAKDITVLEGLEPVRKRPGHVHRRRRLGRPASSRLGDPRQRRRRGDERPRVEHRRDAARRRRVDHGARTTGAGIPVDKHPQTKKSALEVIFTTLHAGGKFEHGNYKTAGGLHGVGASVVNALSKELVATVRRDGAQYEQRFKQGKPVGGVKKLGPARGTGTTVLLPAGPGDLSEDRVRRRQSSASGSRSRATCTRASSSSSRTRPTKNRRRRSSTAKGSLDYLKKIVKERQRGAGARRAVRSRAERRRGGVGSTSCSSGRSRPTSTSAATSTASRPARAARTRTGSAPASARRCGTSSRRTTSRRRA